MLIVAHFHLTHQMIYEGLGIKVKVMHQCHIIFYTILEICYQWQSWDIARYQISLFRTLILPFTPWLHRLFHFSKEGYVVYVCVLFVPTPTYEQHEFNHDTCRSIQWSNLVPSKGWGRITTVLFLAPHHNPPLFIFICHYHSTTKLWQASAMNWLAVTKDYIATSHASSTRSWSISSRSHASSRSWAVQSRSKWNLYEFGNDVQLHQILCWPTSPQPRMWPPLQNRKPFRADGDNQSTGQN